MTNHDSPARPAAPSTMTSNRPRQCHNKLNPAPRSAIAPCCIETQRPTSIVSCGLVMRGVLRGPSADPGVTAVLLEPRIRGVYHLVCHGEILWLGEQSMPDQHSTSVQHLASEPDSLFQQVNRYGHRVSQEVVVILVVSTKSGRFPQTEVCRLPPPPITPGFSHLTNTCLQGFSTP